MKKKLISIITIGSIISINLSIEASSEYRLKTLLKNIEALANPGEGSWPQKKTYSCFVGQKGSPTQTYLEKKRYCGDCKSAPVGIETGYGHCEIFE